MPVEIKITGKTPADAIKEMVELLGKFIAKVERPTEDVDMAGLLEKLALEKLALEKFAKVEGPTEEEVEPDFVPEEKPEPQKRKPRAKKPAPEKTIQEEIEDEDILAGAEPDTEEEEETEEIKEVKGPVQNPAETKKEALSLLMELYNLNEDAKKKVKALLGEYGVKKFSEVAEADASKLLGDAVRIKEAA